MNGFPGLNFPFLKFSSKCPISTAKCSGRTSFLNRFQSTPSTHLYSFWVYYGATFICGGVFILPVVCFCLTEQEKMQGQLATQFMPFSANRVYFNVLQQSNVETCWRCETSLSFVTRNLESQTEYLALSQALSLKTLKVLKSQKLSKRNWWCLSDTFHFSHWNELSKLPS